jgi:ribose/xylose/arabinose/galactoside ABC-type transport system permease subunit
MRQGDLSGAAALVPPWKVAIGAAAGPIVSYVVVFTCACFAVRRGPHPFVVSLGLISNVRFLFLVVPLALFLYTGRPIGGADEVRLAQVSSIPLPVSLVAGLTCLVAGSFWLIRSLPRGRRLRPLLILVAGAASSGVLYAQILGPWLLP